MRVKENEFVSGFTVEPPQGEKDALKEKKKLMAKEAKTLLQWQMTKRAERDRGSREKEI